MLAAATVLIASFQTATAKPHYPGPFVADEALDTLQKRLRAPGADIEEGCRSGGDRADCAGALDRVQAKLAGLRANGGAVRILHLGDSHVAADYITSRIRRDFQKQYGTAGRGFMHPDQRWGYGGRQVWKADKDWTRDRIVDGGRTGRPYGFSGVSLTARRKGAQVKYRVRPEDRSVRIYYGPKARTAVTVWVDKKKIGVFDLSKAEPYVQFELPDRPARAFRRGPDGNTLRIRANRKGVALYGISFSKEAAGVEYTSIGPVGADAKVYLQLNQDSFKGHLAAYKPDLVVYMVGGNDALKIRKGWTTLKRVTEDHRRLFKTIRSAVPNADCLVWAPMLAGRRRGKRVVSKARLVEVRNMQRRVAQDAGCAFWDTMRGMGGPNNVRRWVPVLAKDLVHPRKSAADLIGRMFVRAWMKLD